MKLHRSGSFPARIPLASNSYWDRTISEPSFNATAAYKLTPIDTVKLSYARGVQPPSLIELGGLQTGYSPFPGFNLFILGNPALRPSIVTNYEVAYDHEFKAAKIGLRVFAQDWTDLKSGVGTSGLDIFPTATTDGGLYNINGSDSKMKGVEFTASGKLSADLSWHFDDTYTDVKDSPFAGVDTVGRSIAFQQTTPKTRGNIGGDWVRGPWEVDANLHYVGDFKWYNMVTDALQPVKAFGALSMRAAYKMDNGLVLAVSGQNLLSDRQKQTAGLEAERRLQFTISKTW
jgi:outer membrane receptor for ferrienterochelin and colicins